MFNIILQSIYRLTPKNRWMVAAPISFAFNNLYYLELEIFRPLDDKRKQIQGRYSIRNIYGDRKNFINEKFLNIIKRRIVKKEEPEKPLDMDYKVCFQ